MCQMKKKNRIRVGMTLDEFELDTLSCIKSDRSSPINRCLLKDLIRNVEKDIKAHEKACGETIHVDTESGRIVGISSPNLKKLEFKSGRRIEEYRQEYLRLCKED